ncbi:hypothetical protein AMK21_31920 [Streptomyces sp. CB00316]|uniref:hypothetical protein n=1 Tax=Streptomyces sp. CB00316 TaxID=1703932 RepID=UPI00093A69E9|nr:hypothetical protein [Streptomyces sp. CB00316]OKJ08426.1 hypothetical protein AMK21_31920 [Streptomyces sp. CB00316]
MKAGIGGGRFREAAPPGSADGPCPTLASCAPGCPVALPSGGRSPLIVRRAESADSPKGD